MLHNSLVFVTGSILYPIIEILWRGHTHSSMALAGGLSLTLINIICCGKMQKRSLAAKCAAGSLIITCVEFSVGVWVNLLLHLNVWDYSSLPLDLLGQVCLPFSLIWCVLTLPAIGICRLCGIAAAKLSASGAGTVPSAE